jgi:hypothetical protein
LHRPFASPASSKSFRLSRYAANRSIEPPVLDRALTASFPVSLSSIFCLYAGENGLVTTSPLLAR